MWTERNSKNKQVSGVQIVISNHVGGRLPVIPAVITEVRRSCPGRLSYAVTARILLGVGDGGSW